MKLAKGIGLLLVVLCLTSTRAQAAGSLYQRLGEEPGIRLLVDSFVGRVAADARVNKKFAKANIPRLKKCLVELIVQLGGGPKKYSCRSMKDSHKGMKITDAEFNAAVQDFVWAENKHAVGKSEQKQLAKALLATRKDIVEVSGPAAKAGTKKRK